MRTVYELIQHLSKFPANADLQIVMFTGNEQMEDYLNDSRKAGQQLANIYAEPLRVKQPWNSTVVTLECQACDLLGTVSMAEYIGIENAKITPDDELRIILKMLRENDNIRSVMALDLFTKLYCKDNTVIDDLVFRCSECEFEAQDKRCLVKVMAHKLSPNYKEFGSMGDL